MKCEVTFGDLYNKLQTIRVEQLDIILTHLEKSYEIAQLDEDDIMEIMNPIYSSLIIDACRKNKTDRLKFFFDKYYKNDSNNIRNYYHPSTIYSVVFDYKYKTNEILHLFTFLIKLQIKNLIEHDDSDCEYYDSSMDPKLIKYFCNIGYINKKLRKLFKRFDCNKLRI